MKFYYEKDQMHSRMSLGVFFWASVIKKNLDKNSSTITLSGSDFLF